MIQNHVSKTADYTIANPHDCGMVFDNQAAAGVVIFSLPIATQGQHYEFYVYTAQELRIDPDGTEIIGAGAAGKYLSSSTVGSIMKLHCYKDGEWIRQRESGTWAFET